MQTRLPWLAAAVFLLGAGSSFAQVKDKDPADLLPAETLACLEFRQPARLAREVANLVKGSSLEDIPKRLAKQRGSGGNNDFRHYQRQEMLGLLCVFLSPEMLDEAARLRGGFVALTGFSRDGTPEVVGVLSNGTSNFPGMYMRGFLSMSRANLVGEVEGVPLYRETHFIYNSPPAGGGGVPPQPERREYGPVLGQLPGLLLFGSSVDSLKDVIRRARGKSAAASLTTRRAFRDAAALRDRPGLFAYVDAAALQAKLDELAARPENARSTAWVGALKTILGDQPIRTLTFSLTLQNGSLESQTRFALNEKSDSPLLGLLPDRAAQRELLHFAPKDALLAMAGGFGDNEKRWQSFVNLLDALYNLEGRPGDNRPSRALQEMEKKLNFRIDKDVLADVTGAGLVVHRDWRRKPGQVTLLLRAKDAEAAVRLEKTGLPRLFSLGYERILEPKEEKVQGQAIHIITKWGGLRGPLPAVYYGRNGAVVVIAQDREATAEMLVAGSKKEGLLAESKVADALKETDDRTLAFGVVSSARLMMDLFAVMNRPPAVMRKAVPGGAPQPVEQPPEPALDSTRAGKALVQAAEPMVFTLMRQPDSLVLEMRPLPLRRMMPRLLDAWADGLLTSISSGSGAGLGGGAVVPAPKN